MGDDMNANKIELSMPGFCGFYGSNLSAELDHAENMEADHHANEKDRATGRPDALGLSEWEYGSIFSDCADYGAARLSVSREYVKTAAEVLTEATGAEFDLEFSRLVSPREYNFRTDELCVFVSAETWARIVAEVRADAMTSVATRRHTSRPGFASFYSPAWEAWGEPESYDDVQRDTLFRAWLENWREKLAEMSDDEGTLDIRTDDDVSAGDIFGRLVESRLIGDGSEVFHTAFSDCVDWDKFERLELEALEEKRANA